jgi:hypothetical protein
VIPRARSSSPIPWRLLDTEAMSWQAQDEMRFRIIGGYATIQATQSYGLEYEPLLAPDIVQKYLTTKAYGAFDIFYPPPPANANPRPGSVVHLQVPRRRGRLLESRRRTLRGLRTLSPRSRRADAGLALSPVDGVAHASGKGARPNA